MSWHFSQALVAEFSEANSSVGELSAPSNGTPTHGMFWSPGKTTDASTPSRSGMMFRPLTDTHGEAVLMSCLEASLVRTSAPQAREPESKESEVECGNTWHELSVRFDPASSSWKTHQCLWEEVLPWSSVTLPKWGLMCDGVLWERTTAALHTEETESGLWATPSARDWKDTPGMARTAINADGTLRNREDQLARQVYAAENATGGRVNPDWIEWLMGWPISWTESAALATGKFQQWLHAHGKF